MRVADAVAMSRVPGLPRTTVSLSTTLLLSAAAVLVGATVTAVGLGHSHVRSASIVATASAASPSAPSFVLRNLTGNQCLGIAAHARDRHVLLQRCATGPRSADQDWRWGRANPDETVFYQIVTGGHDCLGLADDSTSPGTSVVVQQCAGPADTDQFWQPAKAYPACTKRSTSYKLLVNLWAVESPTDAALVIGANAAVTTGGRIVLRQWAGQCNDEYWAVQAR